MLIFCWVWPDTLCLVIQNPRVSISAPASESAPHAHLLLALSASPCSGELPFGEKSHHDGSSNSVTFLGISLTQGNSQIFAMPNEGLPHRHRELQPQTLVSLPVRPCVLHGGSVASSTFQCGFHFFIKLLAWQPQLLDLRVSYPWNQIPGHCVLWSFRGHEFKGVEVPLKLLFPGTDWGRSLYPLPSWWGM